MDIDLAWFPLVLRERPPGRPLAARIAELGDLAESLEGVPRPDRITRACEVLNKAALIASDCGLPTLACSLCWHHYELFDQLQPLPSWAIKLAMQPLLNVARQLIREGHNDHAYAMLESLYTAARSRTTIMTGGRVIDFDAAIHTPDDRKTACAILWTALLADGTRALTQAGHWQEAADRAAQHRGIGKRLLDGRQAAIIARIDEGDLPQAAELVEQSQITEPWERTVQSILRVLCQRAAGNIRFQNIATMLTHAHALAQVPNPATAAARTRIGTVALDLATPNEEVQADELRTALVGLATQDAYAAHDLLSSSSLPCRLTVSDARTLHELVHACGLGRGTIPAHLRDRLAGAAAHAAATLTGEFTTASRATADDQRSAAGRISLL